MASTKAVNHAKVQSHPSGQMAIHISETCSACLLLPFFTLFPYSLTVWKQALLGTPSLISACLIQAGVSELKDRTGSLTQNTPVINNVILKTNVC